MPGGQGGASFDELHARILTVDGALQGAGQQGFVLSNSNRKLFPETWYTIPRTTSLITGAPAVNFLHAVPWICPATGILDLVSFKVTVTGGAGSQYRFGLYAGDILTVYPTTVLFDSGDQDGTVVTTVSLAASVPVSAGQLYFGAYVCGTGAPTVLNTTGTAMIDAPYGQSTALGGVQGAFRVAFNYAALPTTFPVSSPTMVAANVVVLGIRYK